MAKDKQDVIFKEATKDKDGNLQFYSPSGEKIRIKYIWNETRDALVEHERIDIVKEMNERAKGTSISEQIARLDHGDTSVIDPSHVTPEDFSTDVSGMPESSIEVVQMRNEIKAEIMRMKAAEEKQVAEMAELKALQEQIVAKKAEYDKAIKAFDEKKAASNQVEEGGKDNA